MVTKGSHAVVPSSIYSTNNAGIEQYLYIFCFNATPPMEAVAFASAFLCIYMTLRKLHIFYKCQYLVSVFPILVLFASIPPGRPYLHTRTRYSVCCGSACQKAMRRAFLI